MSAPSPKGVNPQIEAMRKLGMDETEIAQVLADDKRIDQGEKLFDLGPNAEKVSKEARNAGRKPTVYQFQKRERKADNVKQGLIELLIEVIKEQPACNSLEIVNPEREFLFVWGGKKYKLTLSCPRS